MKQIIPYRKLSFLIVIIAAGLTILPDKANGQQTPQMVRLAKIVVDSVHLDEYKRILKEQAEASVRAEPGVLTLYAISEKENPTHFTILEIYADSAAYRSHLKTPHFIKYKTSTKDMVKSLQLIETTPLIPDMKIKDFNPKAKNK
jgi:quinol monooxygenase YgiN